MAVNDFNMLEVFVHNEYTAVLIHNIVRSPSLTVSDPLFAKVILGTDTSCNYDYTFYCAWSPL